LKDLPQNCQVSSIQAVHVSVLKSRVAVAVMATQEMGDRDRDRRTSALQHGKVLAVQQRSPKTLGQFPLRPTGGQRRVLALLGQNSLRLHSTERNPSSP
jgi:hypothetical protein